MFRFIYTLSLILFLPLATSAQSKYDAEAVLERLDSVIDVAPNYEAAKQARIAVLKRKLANTHDFASRYKLNMQLYEEYRSYKNDSSIVYLTDNASLAKQHKRQDLVNDCFSIIAFQCSTAGHYNDAEAMLAKVDTTQLKGKGFFYYYRAKNHLYDEIAYYSHIKSVKDHAYAMAGLYEAKLLSSLDKNSVEYKEYLCRSLFIAKNYKAAQKVCDEWLKMTPATSRGYAMVAYYEYLININLSNYNYSIYWMGQSAISDVTHAVMDQGSLWSLADYISGSDLNRSYKYIRFAWQCASKFGTSVRSAQISPVLSAIESEYKAKLDKANKTLMIITIIIAVLAVALCFMLYYSIRQRHHLAQARNDLRKRNDELADTNGKLADMNSKLKNANEKITSVNSQLHESNQIKEAYIGRFLALCSEYVDRIDKSRKEVNRLVKAHKIDELYQLSRSTEQKEKDQEELMGYFDRTFLNIFPTFVEDFNELLKPECRIETEAGRLNTTLRIFALIRLGIDDSGKIAEFLHYSVNTIYNYRARTKNGCLGNRDTFEDEVKKLGKI